MENYLDMRKILLCQEPNVNNYRGLLKLPLVPATLQH